MATNVLINFAAYVANAPGPVQVHLTVVSAQTIADLLRNHRFEILQVPSGVRVIHLHEGDFNGDHSAGNYSRAQMLSLFDDELVLSPKVCTYLLNLFVASFCEVERDEDSPYVTSLVHHALEDLYDLLSYADMNQAQMRLVPTALPIEQAFLH